MKTINDDRRASERRRVYFAGEILAPGQASSIECAIRSIGAFGAAIDAPLDAPLTFDLRLPRDGTIHHARTVWRADKRRGVAFARDPLPARSPGPSILELRKTLKTVEIH